MSKKVLEALALLDPAEDSQWTDGGLPRMEVVESLSGENLTREQLTEIAPDFTRENPNVPSEENGSEQDKDSPENLGENDNDETDETDQDLQTEKQAAETKVSELRKKVADASKELKVAIGELDAIVKVEEASSSNTLASDVKAYQKSQAQARAGKVARNRRIIEAMKKVDEEG